MKMIIVIPQEAKRETESQRRQCHWYWSGCERQHCWRKNVELIQGETEWYISYYVHCTTKPLAPNLFGLQTIVYHH